MAHSGRPQAVPPLTSGLIKRLAESADDFGFEMRIGKVLRSAPNARVEHGGTYVAPGIFNNTLRQFDYRAQFSRRHQFLQIAVECKNLFRGSPLVVCGSQRNADESTIDIVASDIRVVSRHKLVKQGITAVVIRNSPTKCYPVGGFVGKSVVRPEPTSREKEIVPDSRYRVTGDSDIYDRWNQAVVHASSMLVNRAPRYRRDFEGPCFSVTIPAVVVPNETLWELQYDVAGIVIKEPQAVDSTTLFTGGVAYRLNENDFVQDSQLSHIHLFTERGISEFVLAIAEESSEFWENFFDPTKLDQYLCARSSVLAGSI